MNYLLSSADIFIIMGMRMKHGALIALVSMLVLPALFATESWQEDAERAGRYYNAGDYDAAWLFYERALSESCDDGLIVYFAAESFKNQDLTENPEFGTALFAVARFFLSSQYPDHWALAETGEYADIVVNRQYLRNTYAVVGAKAPKVKRPVSSLADRVTGFFVTRIGDLRMFFSVLSTEGVKDGFAWAKDHAWRLLFAWILAASLTGIILPVVMALTVAREGRKSYVTAYAFLLHWGVLGIHRFYLGRYVSGIIWLLTGGLLGLGVFFDLFLTGAYVRFWNEDHRESRPGVSGGNLGRGKSRRIKTSTPKKTRAPKPPKTKKPKAAKAPKPPKKPKNIKSSSAGAATGAGLMAAASAAAASTAEAKDAPPLEDDKLGDLSSLDDFLTDDDGSSDDDFSFDSEKTNKPDQSAIDFDSDFPSELDDDEFDIGSLE